MMEELDKKIEEVTTVLFDKFPKYFFELDPNLPYDEYNLKYKGYLCPHGFKNSFGQKVDELIFSLKKQKISSKSINSDIQLIIDELIKTSSTFKLVKFKDTEFQYQKEAIIQIWDGTSSYSEFGSNEENFSTRIAQTSQLKYNYTIRLIEDLKEIVEADKQKEIKDKEPNVDEFFELILDHTPRFNENDKEKYNVLGEIVGIQSIIEYKSFSFPIDYYVDIQNSARKILMYFRKEHALNKLNDEYLEGLAQELYFEKRNFVLRKIGDIEFLCHSNAYYTSAFEIEDEKHQLDELKAKRFIEAVKLYNQYRYEIIEYLINGIEKIIKRISIESENPEKLELQVPVADLVLLFRLLKENNVFKAKHNTHIFRVIQNSFNVPGKDNFNEGSIKNAFNSPDPNSVKNLEFLLANIKTSLKKI